MKVETKRPNKPLLSLYDEFDRVIGSGGSSSKGKHIPLNDEGGTENTNEKYSWIHGF